MENTYRFQAVTRFSTGPWVRRIEFTFEAPNDTEAHKIGLEKFWKRVRKPYEWLGVAYQIRTPDYKRELEGSLEFIPGKTW